MQRSQENISTPSSFIVIPESSHTREYTTSNINKIKNISADDSTHDSLYIADDTSPRMNLTLPLPIRKSNSLSNLNVINPSITAQSNPLFHRNLDIPAIILNDNPRVRLDIDDSSRLAKASSLSNLTQSPSLTTPFINTSPRLNNSMAPVYANANSSFPLNMSNQAPIFYPTSNFNVTNQPTTFGASPLPILGMNNPQFFILDANSLSALYSNLAHESHNSNALMEDSPATSNTHASTALAANDPLLSSNNTEEKTKTKSVIEKTNAAFSAFEIDESEMKSDTPPKSCCEKMRKIPKKYIIGVLCLKLLGLLIGLFEYYTQEVISDHDH